MTIKIGSAGGSPWRFPQLPEPLTGEGRVFNQGNIIPHGGTLIDNVELPTAFSTGATGDIVGNLNTSAVWTVNATDINAAADGFNSVASFWYDSTNDRLYVFALDTGTTPDTLYTAYITLETGAVTTIGNAQFGTDPTAASTEGRCAVERGAIASGNFILHYADRDITINATTGAEVANVAAVNVSENGIIGNYVTLDGTITFSTIGAQSANSQVILTKGGQQARVSMPDSVIAGTDSATMRVSNWGDKVKLYAATVSTNRILMRTFLRADFDAWLQDIMKLGGQA